METFADQEKFERMQALRVAGAQAAELRDFEGSSSHFAEAAKIALELQQDGMAAGLLADQAVSEFLRQNKKSALILATQALEWYESLGEQVGISASNAHLILLANAILWMRQELGRSEYEGFVVVPGSCSEPNPHADLAERPAPPFLLLWYQLAILESELNVDCGVLAKLNEKSGSQICVPYDIELVESQLLAVCIEPDHEKFIGLLSYYLAVLNKAEEGQLSNSMVLVRPENAEAVAPNEWCDSKYYATVLHALTAFCLGALCENSDRQITQLTNNLSDLDKQNKVLLFLERVENRNEHPLDTRAETLIADNIFLCRTLEDTVTPEQAFTITFYLWSWFSGSPYRNAVASSLAELVSSIWKRMLNSRVDLLINSEKTALEIRNILEGKSQGFRKTALILLAANEGMEKGLPDEILAEIKNAV